MNAGKVFVDSNVLLYTIDTTAPQKRAVAQDVVRDACRERRGVVSSQVLKEFAANLIRKAGRTPEEVALLCADVSELVVVREGLAELLDALRLMRISSISFWDACIVASARSARCSVLLTEDLSHGQVIEGVRIHNPFLP